MDSIQRAHFEINTLLPSSDSRYFSPEEIDSAVNSAVLDLFNQQYKVFGETQRISDDLARFKTLSPIDLAAGIGPLPEGHVYTLSIYVTKIGTQDIIKRCRIVEEQFIAQYIDSEAFGPSEDNVIARLVGDNVRVYPETVSQIGMTFFRKPLAAKFAYTMTGLLNNIPVYDPINSLQIDYGDSNFNQLVQKALTYLGVAQKDQTLMQEQGLFRQMGTPEAR
jgi:hypothetical protein